MTRQTSRPKASSKSGNARRKTAADELPPATDWRTTDDQEVLKRRLRAREDKARIVNLDPGHPVFSNFAVHSPSGLAYQVEIRDLATRRHACTCTDFRINGLGTCKHVEAVHLHLTRREKTALLAARSAGSGRTDLVPDPAAGTLRIERHLDRLPARLRAFFSANGLLLPGQDPAEIAAEIAASGSTPVPGLRVSQEVSPWIEARARARERILLRRDYETGVASGRHPGQVTTHPLFPYQREGMLHLAFTERAHLADEMGLADALRELRHDGEFYAHGVLETPMPSLAVEGVGRVAFPVPPAQAASLVTHAAVRAPYGRGAETLIDSSVRNVWQIAPEKIALGGSGWATTLQALTAAWPANSAASTRP